MTPEVWERILRRIGENTFALCREVYEQGRQDGLEQACQRVQEVPLDDPMLTMVLCIAIKADGVRKVQQPETVTDGRVD